MKLRRAHLDDVDAMLVLKQELVYEVSQGTTTRGGFLLGTDTEGYRRRISDARAWVMDDGAVQGFAIVLPDAAFRKNEVWERRDAVAWEGVEVGDFDPLRLCYYDQLAVRRGGYTLKRWGAALAFTALWDALAHHDHMVTSTVSEPVLNLAAVPYLTRVGATQVGRLDEDLPPIGPLVSDIWLLPRQAVEARMAAPGGRAEAWVVDCALEALS